MCVSQPRGKVDGGTGHKDGHMAKRSKKEKIQAAHKQRLKAKRAEGSTSYPSPSPLPKVALDLRICCVQLGAAGVPSGGGADERY